MKSITQDQLHERLLRPDVISGSEMLLRSLLLEGVEYVFGYPGGSVLYIYDAIYDYGELKHVLARHEQGAIHAADGYARSSGKTGVCIATSGPGATNVITGIAMAYKDNIPLVVITGNVPLSVRGTDAFQEADVIGMTLSITKHNYFITDAEDIPATVRAAFQIANTGRKGPVLIDIPKDISSHRKVFRFREQAALPVRRSPQPPDERQLEAVLREVEKAAKPLILCGEGVDHTGVNGELLDFAGKATIPVVSTYHGVCGFPARHPLALGITGTQGSETVDIALRECDLLIIIGTRLDHRIIDVRKRLSPEARIVHIDLDEDPEAGVFIHACCYGDLQNVLAAAARKVKAGIAKGWSDRLTALHNSEGQYRKNGESGPDSGTLTIREALRLISSSVPRDVVVTVDEQPYLEQSATAFCFGEPRSLLSPIGMEGPGFSLPAAIGAQMAYPERMVISINGEGGIQKNVQELAVCAIRNIPLKIVLFSDRDPSGNKSPDFIKLAEAFGLKGWRVERLEEVHDVWVKAMNASEPVLVEFCVERS